MFLGYCGKCGRDVMIDYCDHCQEYTQSKETIPKNITDKSVENLLFFVPKEPNMNKSHNADSWRERERKEAEKRVDKMKDLMMRTDFSLKRICFEIGILERNAARVFKAKTGKTMLQYRKEQMKKHPSEK